MDSNLNSIAHVFNSCGTNIENNLLQNLEGNGIQTFFPVQQAVIPILLRHNTQSATIPRDICVSAPTGSGKTISYALPIIHILQRENGPTKRLRALILQPSRELALQVFNVIHSLTFKTIVRAEVATGQGDYSTEKDLLVPPETNNSLFARSLDSCYSSDSLGRSNVDILVCTPGRLLEHLQRTNGFTLQHLRFLVLDEADRLLGNAYHHWVRLLLQSSSSSSATPVGGGESSLSLVKSGPSCRIQRLLFSATLTDNPRKLAMLGIFNPMVIFVAAADTGVGEVGSSSSDPARMQYNLPSQLTEATILCEAKEKPLTLLALLEEAFASPPLSSTTSATPGRHLHASSCVGQGSLCLVFVSSLAGTAQVETARRLTLLLQTSNDSSGDGIASLWGGAVVEMSRQVGSAERAEYIQAAQAGKVRVIVCSDLTSRGIDLPGVRLVVNYDPPSPKQCKVYVHRAGRTARANLPGHCVTLLKRGQVGGFRTMREQIAFHTGAISANSSSGGASSPISPNSTEPHPDPITNPNPNPITDLATSLNAGVVSSALQRTKRKRGTEQPDEVSGGCLGRIAVDSVGQHAIEKMRPIYRTALGGLAVALGEQKGKQKKKKIYRLR